MPAIADEFTAEASIGIHRSFDSGEPLDSGELFGGLGGGPVMLYEGIIPFINICGTASVEEPGA